MTSRNGHSGFLENPASGASQGDSETVEAKQPYWRIGVFLLGLVIDLVLTIVLLSHLFPGLKRFEGETPHFTFYGSLLDLSFLAFARLACSVTALLISYCRGEVQPEHYPFEKTHPNGERKSREELELEALEEPFWPWLKRFVWRPAFLVEFLGVLTQIDSVAKCLARMNVEIGTLIDAEPSHPLFWVAAMTTAVFSAAEASFCDDMCKLAGHYGRKQRMSREQPSLLRQITSSLNIPLMADQDNIDATDVDPEESGLNGENGASTVATDEDPPVVSDITADAHYKATWKDLLAICLPDLHFIIVAFVFLLLAAIAQVYIPKYLGNILDSLAEAFADNDDDAAHHRSMFDVPGFMENIKLLVTASVLAGVFAGIRGSCFSVVGGRVNVRLRVQLMDALLSQDTAFFDVTKTGDITSRLSSDTTLVGDQVSLNVNVFLRSLVQAVGVLLFMFLVSWQLSILAFISVPLITLLSKCYGNYIRSLTKLMQKKLADGNSVSEASLAAMATVRAFDAAEKELSEFEKYMKSYIEFNNKSAFAYCGFAALVTSLPQLIYAVVVFYGGLLVRNGDMTSGQLVSFLLYLTSLSDAFGAIGWVFSSLTQAVGAADKVFELMHRKPKLKKPLRSDPPPPGALEAHSGIPRIKAYKIREQRSYGLWPATSRGEIVLENVDLYYPARPTRQILKGLSLKVEPGSVVALVGESGGGKSSIVSLIQHLYEPSAGRVMLDGIDVHELAPAWLSKHVSVVSQQPTLFGRTIRRNIMYGLEGTDSEPSQEEIENAAKLANAHDFIMSLPNKYEAEVGERGVQLSGGQRQRIAIARALVRHPRYLLLDEATSALDAESEHLVQKAIDDMIFRGKNSDVTGAMTVIIIAHRLSTVRSADNIFVIKGGEVVEQGTHNDLIADSDGVYTALIKRQMESTRQLEGIDGTTNTLGESSAMEK